MSTLTLAAIAAAGIVVGWVAARLLGNRTLAACRCCAACACGANCKCGPGQRCGAGCTCGAP